LSDVSEIEKLLCGRIAGSGGDITTRTFDARTTRGRLFDGWKQNL
jgi:hypothetical protein